MLAIHDAANVTLYTPRLQQQQKKPPVLCQLAFWAEWTEPRHEARTCDTLNMAKAAVGAVFAEAMCVPGADGTL